VVGIVVLITLIMIIELISKSTMAQDAEMPIEDVSQEVIEELERSNAELRKKHDRLAERVENMREQAVLSPKEYEAKLEEKWKSVQDELSELSSDTAKLKDQLKKTVEDTQMADTLDRRLAEMVRDLESVTEQIGSLETKQKILLADDSLIFKKSNLEGRFVVIVDIYPNQYQVIDVETSKRTIIDGANSKSTLQSWIRNKDVARTHYMLFIRPEGSDNFDALKDFLEAEGASFGFDVIGTGKRIRMSDEMQE
jgi:DNA repair exonuclease SbcCD ATPase subunit